MSHFETNPKTLKDILRQVNAGELALPNFQRNFVWDPGATEELIESIMRRYPAGSLLFLKHMGEGFDVREFEGAPGLTSKSTASAIVLDGQQRLTSLYQAFFGRGEHRFFLDLKALRGPSDIEEAVWHETFTRSRGKGYLDREYQARELICPLEVIFGKNGGFHAWVDEIMEIRSEQGEDVKPLRAEMRQIHEQWIAPIMEYPFPVITLPANTPLDAVCKMFETLNRRGVKLTVFELLMARAYANSISLRDMWEKAIKENPIIEEFGIDPYYVLQVVSLLSKKSIKRSDVLNLEPKIISQHWKDALGGMNETLKLLQNELGVLHADLLPYNPMIVPLTAFFVRVSDIKGPKIGAVREKLMQWFWASVFSQAYEKSPTSRVVSDFKELTQWLFEEGPRPKALDALYFSPDLFLGITPQQRALYRGTLLLATSNGARDLHNGEKLTSEYLERERVDDHHIFPHDYLKGKYPEDRINGVLNRTLIDAITNRRIQANAPSRYVGEIVKELGTEKTRQVFESHLIPYNELVKDDFGAFCEARAHVLFEALQKKVGFPIPNTPPEVEFEDTGLDEEEETTPRDKIDPAFVNARPEALLADEAPWVGELFDKFTDIVRQANPDIWWKVKAHSLSYLSPDRTFIDLTISRKGLRGKMFTRGKPIAGVEPIVQRDHGGALWGRFSIGKNPDWPHVSQAVRESFDRIKKAVEGGEKTGWWATRPK